MDSNLVKGYLLGLQARIVDALASLDGAPFRRDEWLRPEGGGVFRGWWKRGICSSVVG